MKYNMIEAISAKKGDITTDVRREKVRRTLKRYVYFSPCVYGLITTGVMRAGRKHK